MNRAKITHASKTLQRLETAQSHFNDAVNDLSDEELAVFMQENGVTLEPSKAKERIKNLLETKEAIS